MHPLRLFVTQLACVALVALVPVGLAAFIAMPLALGHHPGEACSVQEPATIDRHMT